MVDRVVQRPFLLWVAEAASRAGKGKPDKPLPAGAAEVTGPELAEVKRALTQSVAQERGKPVVHPKSQGGRRGAYAAPIDHLAYFPRDALLSITQSAVEEFLEEHASKRLRPVTEKEGRRGGGGSWSPVADYILDIPDDAIPGEQEQNRRLGGVGEITDPRWIISVAAMGWRKLKHRYEFHDSPAPPHRLAENARVIAVGDWAIGSKRARRVAHQIREVLDADDSTGRDCHVIHLGDTYYGGWDREYRKRFLPHWPVREGEPHGSWSLNGNHDMYTGGHGYFEVLLNDARFAPFHQGSSWFSLENDHWQLLGLDSSWADHDLAGSQPRWVASKVEEHPNRKTMLLSHHQPFSAYEDVPPQLVAKLGAALAKGPADAWLWGHEHRCVAYKPRDQVRLGRCVGHGGIPVYADNSRTPSSVSWRLRKSFRVGLETWAMLGFAVLDFDGPKINIRYLNERGVKEKSETIE
jgi:Calcineurin-like phosphoesterase